MITFLPLAFFHLILSSIQGFLNPTGTIISEQGRLVVYCLEIQKQLETSQQGQRGE